jgi:hypothetical protein
VGEPDTANSDADRCMLSGDGADGGAAGREDGADGGDGGARGNSVELIECATGQNIGAGRQPTSASSSGDVSPRAMRGGVRWCATATAEVASVATAAEKSALLMLQTLRKLLSGDGTRQSQASSGVQGSAM